MIDGAKNHIWLISIQKGAGPVVNGLTCNLHVICIHYTVDKAAKHPFCYKVCLAYCDLVEERTVWIF